MPITDSGTCRSLFPEHADRYFQMMALSQGDRFAVG